MNSLHGHIDQSALGRKDDYLFRLTLKGLVVDDSGNVLVVKETGRDWWDLPGGGMDHGESIKAALARELAEEVNLKGDFTYSVIHMEDPALLQHANVLQVRIIFTVIAENMVFSPGVDGDEVAFMDPESFKDSDNDAERRIYEYARLKA